MNEQAKSFVLISKITPKLSKRAQHGNEQTKVADSRSRPDVQKPVYRRASAPETSAVLLRQPRCV